MGRSCAALRESPPLFPPGPFTAQPNIHAQVWNYSRANVYVGTGFPCPQGPLVVDTASNHLFHICSQPLLSQLLHNLGLRGEWLASNFVSDDLSFTLPRPSADNHHDTSQGTILSRLSLRSINWTGSNSVLDLPFDLEPFSYSRFGQTTSCLGWGLLSQTCRENWPIH